MQAVACSVPSRRAPRSSATMRRSHLRVAPARAVSVRPARRTMQAVACSVPSRRAPRSLATIMPRNLQQVGRPSLAILVQRALLAVHPVQAAVFSETIRRTMLPSRRFLLASRQRPAQAPRPVASLGRANRPRARLHRSSAKASRRAALAPVVGCSVPSH